MQGPPSERQQLGFIHTSSCVDNQANYAHLPKGCCNAKPVGVQRGVTMVLLEILWECHCTDVFDSTWNKRKYKKVVVQGYQLISTLILSPCKHSDTDTCGRVAIRWSLARLTYPGPDPAI